MYYDFKKLKEINLHLILTQLLYALEIGTNERYNTRKYQLPNGHKIAVTDLKWIDNTSNIGGKGALDLVMLVKSVTLKEAAEILSSFSASGQCYSSTLNRQFVGEILIPEPCHEYWPHVRNYLCVKRRLPKFLVDKLYDYSLIWSDCRKNCVFPRDLKTGAYLRGTSETPFKMTIGRNGRPYVIPGFDEIICITEAPIDAITLKYYMPSATILATGGRLGFDKIEPYLSKAKKIFLAQDNDKAGDDQANQMARLIHIETERKRPLYDLKDWNAVLIHECITQNLIVD
jgi:hypothetical protein